MENERTAEIMPEVEIQVIAPDGLGFGEGGISYKSRKEEVGSNVMAKAEQAAQSPDILIEVSKDSQGQQIDDDGCGDGRNVARIFKGKEEKFKSLQRPKVFGGGVAMAAASHIGLGLAHRRTLRDTFSDGMSSLRDMMVGFGAHTDTHAHSGNCGCGAIDKAPRIVENAVRFKHQITSTMGTLGIDITGLDEVFSEFEAFAPNMQAEAYKGADVMSEIVDNGKIVKQLDDNHKEALVILNRVRGYTVNQEKIREATDGEVQAFAVDVWRIEELANRLYKNEPESVRYKAFLSMIVYTLSTAGTLTNGDQPVSVISEQSELVAA